MISRVSLDDRVREWGLREDIVEKDYVLGWLLWGIGSEPALREQWVFKGGTCLKKCYIETYRFSEDLDFTVLNDGPVASDEVLPPLRRILDRVNQASGIEFAVQAPRLRLRPNRNASEGRVYYVGPRAAPGRVKESAVHRGSRKHVLDWVERPEFPFDLTRLLEPSGAAVTSGCSWMPRSHSDDEEARLDVHGAALFGESTLWRELWSCWLRHNGKANTPNWDIASDCEVNGGRGLVLVEAKANVQELKRDGKGLKLTASERSRENHKQIGAAIAEASDALAKVIPGVALSRDSHYQLSNRVALSWKIAHSGTPVILVYLGFTGDSGIADVGEPLHDDAHWHRVFEEHMDGVLPAEFLERQIDCGAASMRMLVRSRPVLEPSRAG